MELDEVIITRVIFDEYSKTFLDYTDIDLVLVGGGPANVVAAKYMAEGGKSRYLSKEDLSRRWYVGWWHDVPTHSCARRGSLDPGRLWD